MIRTVFVYAALFVALSSNCIAGDLDVPIHIEAADGQIGLCPTSRVTGLHTKGDNFLSVRSGPGDQYRELDRLHNGDVVNVFEVQGKWAGVAYGYNIHSADCNSKVRRVLTLPSQGWISTVWLVDEAG